MLFWWHYVSCFCMKVNHLAIWSPMNFYVFSCDFARRSSWRRRKEQREDEVDKEDQKKEREIQRKKDMGRSMNLYYMKHSNEDIILLIWMWPWIFDLKTWQIIPIYSFKNFLNRIRCIMAYIQSKVASTWDVRRHQRVLNLWTSYSQEERVNSFSLSANIGKDWQKHLEARF